MVIRNYKTAACAEITELFYNTFHIINAKDYNKIQINIWFTRNVDISFWNKFFLEHNALIAAKYNVIVVLLIWIITDI